MVIVNGIPRDIPYQRCVRCISDSTCPGITFDAAGVCNFCYLHDRWCRLFPNDERGQQILQQKINQIKKDGKGKKYDCIVGISGGRDSTYLLYLCVKKYGLRPLAVHFNDGFDNPVAGENMLYAVRKLGVDLITITSDWREARDLKIAFLKASTPDLNEGTDVGIGAACYGVAHQQGIKHILFGQSFRTEGIKPISWAYFESRYLNDVHRRFGTVKLQPWKADRPGYQLAPTHLFYYSVIKGIRLLAPLYYERYIRKEAEALLSKELNWVYPGAHYYDDLYWALITYVHRVKFNIDFRINSYSALIRDGQMERTAALEAIKKPYVMEDPRIIDLCLKRLQISREQFDEWMALPPKTFHDYRTSYPLLKTLRPLIRLVMYAGYFPPLVYDKYFLCGE